MDAKTIVWFSVEYDRLASWAIAADLKICQSNVSRSLKFVLQSADNVERLGYWIIYHQVLLPLSDLEIEVCNLYDTFETMALNIASSSTT